jgi:hypothetical protein
LKKDTSKALKTKTTMSTGLKNFTENAWFTGEREKEIWPKSKRKKKNSRLN